MIGPNESNLDNSKYIIVMVQTIPELIASQACFLLDLQFHHVAHTFQDTFAALLCFM